MQVVEVFSVHTGLKKVLYPDCAGHFSLSPSLTCLPLSSFFKHMQVVFPFKALLFFTTDGSTSPDTTILPASLTQGDVTVLRKVTETAVIASPFFEDSPVDVSCSDNLIHIPLDRYLSKIEISPVELRDPMELNKLFNDTCVVYEKIILSNVKYYHDAESENVHLTQTYLYTKCQSKGKTGIKMDQPVWKTATDSVSPDIPHTTHIINTCIELWGAGVHSNTTKCTLQFSSVHMS